MNMHGLVRKLIVCIGLGVTSLGLARTLDADNLLIKNDTIIRSKPDGVNNARAIRTQSLVKKGKKGFMIDTSNNGLTKYGVNLGADNYRINLGVVDGEHNQGRVLGLYTGNNGFIGGEAENLYRERKRNTRLGFDAGINFPFANLEVVVDNFGNLLGVGYVKGKIHSLSLGGGQRGGPGWEGNCLYGVKTGKRSSQAYMRFGRNVNGGRLLEVRARTGKKVSPVNIVFGTLDYSWNSASTTGDITAPLFIEDFAFGGANKCNGDERGDFAVDVRYTKGKMKYADVAINLGDFWLLKRAGFNPKVYRDLAKGVNGANLGVQGNLGDTGLRVHYSRTLLDGRKSQNAVWMRYMREF